MGNQAPPIKLGAAAVALDERVFSTATVTGSPAAAAETIVATLTLSQDLVVTEGCLVLAYAAFTMGTDGVSWNMRIRKTDVSGTILKASGVVELAATKLGAHTIFAFDTSPTLPGQVYVATLIMALGSAPSTVSAVTLAALVV